ncbi:hypothetical protein J2X61_001756 [Bacillus sp. 3255]|nr:hypothetical protein [Bacillus sp. 3255]
MSMAAKTPASGKLHGIREMRKSIHIGESYAYHRTPAETSFRIGGSRYVIRTANL